MADETASKTERRPIVAPTTVGWRYTALIKERNCTQQELNAFLASEFASEARNVSTFLRDGVNASRAVRAVLIAFASTKLNVTLSESWFDVGWHSSAPIDTFATENSGYDSFIRSSCGKYFHVSAKARPLGSTDLSDAQTATERIWRAGKLSLDDNGANFGFKMGSGASEIEGDNPFSGFAVCHSDAIFLTGFDTRNYENAIFLVLRKAAKTLIHDDVKFCGIQTSTLPLGNTPNGRAVAKRVVLVKDHTWLFGWKCGKDIPVEVLEWLHADGTSCIANLIIERSDET